MADYVERQKVIDCFEKCLVEYPNNSVISIKRSFENLPAEDVAPVRHGRWIKRGYACGDSEFICSVCGESEWRTSSSRMKYCMFCGAIMDLEQFGKVEQLEKSKGENENE